MDSNVSLSANGDCEFSKQKCSTHLNITSLNSDCLRLIFENLEMRDMVNIADTCNSFKKDVCWAFEQKFSGFKRVELEFLDRRFSAANSVAKSSESYPLLNLKLIRNFGHTITKLHLRMSSFWCNKVESYVNKYCYKSMEELSFYRCFVKLFDLKNPFVTLATLKFVECSFHYSTMFTEELFPNLKHLKLKLNYHYAPLIVPHMPKLVRLSFTPKVIAAHETYRLIHENEIIEFLKINSQLERLTLHLLENHGHRILRCISIHLQSLRKLNLIVFKETIFETTHELFQFDNVKDFHLRMRRRGIVSRNPFVFKKLKSFSVTDCFFDNDSMVDFCDKNEEISRLDICSNTLLTFPGLELTIAERILSTVEELSLYYVFDISIKSFLEILKQSHKLKKFRLFGECHESKSYQDICNEIASSVLEYEETTGSLDKRFGGSIYTVKFLQMFFAISHNSTVMKAKVGVKEEENKPLYVEWKSRGIVGIMVSENDLMQLQI